MSQKSQHILLCCIILLAIYFLTVCEISNKNFTNVQEIKVASIKQHLAEQLKCNDKPLEMQRLQHGSYWVIQNFVRGNISRNMGCADSITYATNGDYTFFGSLETVVKRWLAPVSFAVYAPGYDINGTLESIQYVRNCLPESDLIQNFVTFHVFFPAEHMPQYVPQNETEVLKWPFDCKHSPYANVETGNLYRKERKLTYPINVARNIARKAVNTYFIFTCDIELFPSPGLVDKFLRMVKHNTSLAVDIPGSEQKPRVFVLNIFELQSNASLPNTKQELKKMLKLKKAIRFHSRVCGYCHKLPYHEEWLKSSSVNETSVIGVAKRLGKHKAWEPFYISDNKEPMFDERVTWEGQSNKRIQGYAMCLLDYDYNILNDGFLVHSPGIKRYNAHDPRMKYVRPMNRLIRKVIMKEYDIFYGKNLNGCVV